MPAAGAYETDQYSNRLLPIRDSLAPLNDRVNRVLARAVATWSGPRDDWRLARRVYWELGGLYWVDHIERWAMDSPAIDKLPQNGHHSIFAGAGFLSTRVNFIFGVGNTIQVAGVLIGTDKLGHFFSQGVKYYGSHLRGDSDERVVARGELNERWLFGQLTTGVYSNADLVANYEGYLFYRSLFEDGIVAGKLAIVRWVRDPSGHDRPTLQRPFDWQDHVNDYWDEALNPSFVETGLQHWFDRRLPLLCDEYRQNPPRFVPRDSERLERQYAKLGLKPAPQNRMDHVCGQPPYGVRARRFSRLS